MKLLSSITTILLISSVAASGQITGSGTLNNVTKFSSGSSVTSSIIYDNGTNVGIGNIAPAYKLEVTGTGKFTGDMLVNNINIGIGAGAVATNLMVGNNAGINNSTGDNNTFIGNLAGKLTTTGYKNVFVGSGAGQANNTGYFNTFIGQGAGGANTSGTSNNFFGYTSGAANTTGTFNTFFGYGAGLNNTTGSNNMMLGGGAGRYIADGVTAATILNNSVFLGSNTKAAGDNQTNQIVIGYNSVGLGSNTTVLGNSFTTTTSVYGKVGIGTTTPVAKLDVVGISGTNIDFQSTGRMRIKSPDGGIWFNDNTTDKSFVGYAAAFANHAMGIYSPVAGWAFNMLQNGNVLIGKTTQTNASYMLDVNGNARANRVTVNTTGADFVFEPDYKLPSLIDVENFIKVNHHLQGIATAAEMQQDGIELGANQTKLLQKLEELTLYIIEQNKIQTMQKNEISDLKNQLLKLTAMVEELTK
jgi:trimeric autotransporter adhesin